MGSEAEDLARTKASRVRRQESEAQQRPPPRLRLGWRHTTRAHLQPLTCLVADWGVVVTGSQDHTLKVYRSEDHFCAFTLHGHCGPLTAVFVDRTGLGELCSASGSQDGALCVWDLTTGACMYSIQAHDGALLSLAYSSSYVVSMGSDRKLCVWERFQGHLINSIHLVSIPRLEFVLEANKAGHHCLPVTRPRFTHVCLFTGSGWWAAPLP